MEKFNIREAELVIVEEFRYFPETLETDEDFMQTHNFSRENISECETIHDLFDKFMSLMREKCEELNRTFKRIDGNIYASDMGGIRFLSEVRFVVIKDKQKYIIPYKFNNYEFSKDTKKNLYACTL